MASSSSEDGIASIKDLRHDELDQVVRQLTENWDNEAFADDPTTDEQHQKFNLLVGAVILLNAGLIGVETEAQAQAGAGNDIDEGLASLFYILNNILQAFFICELGLRVNWERKAWLFSVWNWFDVFCVLCAAVDLWLFRMIGGGGGALKLMTALRVVRLLRLARLLRVFRMFRELYVICVGLVEAVRSIFWVAVILVLLLYISAIFLTQIIAGDEELVQRLAGTAEEMDAEVRFGTLFRSMWTLFELTTMEGWTDLARPLLEMSPVWGLFFLLFLMVTNFGLINMIIGMIVEQTLAMANENEAKIQRRKHQELVRVLKNLRLAFLETDTDGSMSISEKEFDLALCENPVVRGTLEQVGIPVDEARGLFGLLDRDGNGELDAREFLVGCLQLRGPAKAVDTWHAQKDMREMKTELREELRQTRAEMHHIREEVISKVLRAIGGGGGAQGLSAQNQVSKELVPGAAGQALREEVKAEVREELKAEVREELRAEVQSALQEGELSQRQELGARPAPAAAAAALLPGAMGSESAPLNGAAEELPAGWDLLAKDLQEVAQGIRRMKELKRAEKRAAREGRAGGYRPGVGNVAAGVPGAGEEVRRSLGSPPQDPEDAG